MKKVIVLALICILIPCSLLAESFEPSEKQTREFLLHKLNFSVKEECKDIHISGGYYKIKQNVAFEGKSLQVMDVKVLVKEVGYGGSSDYANWSGYESKQFADYKIEITKIKDLKTVELTNHNFTEVPRDIPLILMDVGLENQDVAIKREGDGKFPQYCARFLSKFENFTEHKSYPVIVNEPSRIVKALKHLAKIHDNDISSETQEEELFK